MEATPRPRRNTLDVSALPTSAFGSRDPLWWGVIGLLAIESTMFVLLVVAHYDLRANFSPWPPTALSTRSWTLGTLNLGLLLLSCVPNRWITTGSLSGDLPRIKRGFILATALAVMALGVRAYQFQALPFRWDTHAYGSAFWTLLGLHTFHLLTSTLENLLFLALIYFGPPLEEKHLVDFNVSGLYWYFVVVSWVAIYAVLFLDPGLFRSGLMGS